MLGVDRIPNCCSSRSRASPASAPRRRGPRSCRCSTTPTTTWPRRRSRPPASSACRRRCRRSADCSSATSGSSSRPSPLWARSDTRTRSGRSWRSSPIRSWRSRRCRRSAGSRRRSRWSGCCRCCSRSASGLSATRCSSPSRWWSSCTPIPSRCSSGWSATSWWTAAISSPTWASCSRRRRARETRMRARACCARPRRW